MVLSGRSSGFIGHAANEGLPHSKRTGSPGPSFSASLTITANTTFVVEAISAGCARYLSLAFWRSSQARNAAAACSRSSALLSLRRGRFRGKIGVSSLISSAPCRRIRGFSFALDNPGRSAGRSGHVRSILWGVARPLVRFERNFAVTPAVTPRPTLVSQDTKKCLILLAWLWGSRTTRHPLPPKADIAEHRRDVRFVPKSGHPATHSITSSARNKSDVGMDIPKARAVRMLSTVSNFVGRSIGSVAGSAPRATLPARTPTSRYKLSRLGP